MGRCAGRSLGNPPCWSGGLALQAGRVPQAFQHTFTAGRVGQLGSITGGEDIRVAGLEVIVDQDAAFHSQSAAARQLKPRADAHGKGASRAEIT